MPVELGINMLFRTLFFASSLLLILAQSNLQIRYRPAGSNEDEQNALGKLNEKCKDKKLMYCPKELIDDARYGYRTRLRCLKKFYSQFLKELPFEESYLHNSSKWEKLDNCIFSVPEISLISSNVNISTQDEEHTVCPWEWTNETDEIPERKKMQIFPEKRMYAKCKCQDCQHIGAHSMTSSCKPRYVLKPMLLKINDGRWKFFMEKVSVACVCTKNRQDKPKNT